MTFEIKALLKYNVNQNILCYDCLLFSNSFSGGYAFFETSQLPDSPKAQNTVSAMIASETLDSTGSDGYCVSFR